ncbi:MAG TPA: aminotransferase class I/II-fold pyridoxal phosphate-dependent enzyme, partial [Dehalococcoidia bacterium]|nr:aminotransferase class I/II-fold pyridoxal phosphate-dependent enzyme [Dehalococcoidia bacterium]
MIPVLDLGRQYSAIKGEIDGAIAEVLAAGQFVLGGQVAALEEEFAAYLGAGEAVAVASGTDALRLSLLAAGLEPGDEVITVSFTAYATVAAVLAAGGRPVLVDVDPTTCTMDPERAAAAVTPRTKAIIPVHLYGHPADMGPILELAQRRGLVVIEDACQAHGARYQGQKASPLRFAQGKL